MKRFISLWRKGKRIVIPIFKDPVSRVDRVAAKAAKLEQKRVTKLDKVYAKEVSRRQKVTQARDGFGNYSPGIINGEFKKVYRAMRRDILDKSMKRFDRLSDMRKKAVDARKKFRKTAVGAGAGVSGAGAGVYFYQKHDKRSKK